MLSDKQLSAKKALRIARKRVKRAKKAKPYKKCKARQQNARG